MTYAQTNYRTEAGRTIYSYRQRVPLFAPRAWLWCALGGVAIGVTGAIANVAVEVVDDMTFGAVAAGVAAIAALVLFGLLRLSTRSGDVLRVSFDVLAGTVDVYRRGAHPATVRYTLTEVAEFQSVNRETEWQHTCALVMHTTTQQRIMLIAVDRSCMKHTGLAEFAGRLNMARDAALNDMRAVPPRPVQQPYIAPTAQRPAMPPPRHDYPAEHERFGQRNPAAPSASRRHDEYDMPDRAAPDARPRRPSTPNLPSVTPEMPHDDQDETR